MADPIASDIAGGVVTTATTTVAFTAQAAGRLLVLAIAADDYRTTSGSGRPESTGWTYVNGQQGNLGLYVWYRVSDGTETSVQYTIGSGARSVHKVLSITDIDSSSPLGVNTAAQGAISGGNTSYAVPTITPTAGARWIVVGVGGVTGNNTSGPYTWPAGWAKIGTDRYHTTGYRPGVTAGSKVQDGGAPSGAATVTWTASGDQGMAVTVAFKNASGGGSNANETPTDSAGVTDATSAIRAAARTLADVADGTDSATATRNADRSQADPALATDTLGAAYARASDVTDAAPITDGITVTWVRAATLTDTADGLDAATAERSSTGAQEMADAAAASDSMAVTWARVSAVIDGVGAADALTVTLGSASTHADTAAGSDAVTVTWQRESTLSDAAGATDQVGTSGSSAPDRTVSDAAAGSDAVTVEWSRIATIGDGGTVTDVVTVTTGGPVRDVTILSIVETTRIVTITDVSREVTITEHPRTITITEA